LSQALYIAEVLFAPSFNNRSADAALAMLILGMSSDVDGCGLMKETTTNAYITGTLYAVRGTHSGTIDPTRAIWQAGVNSTLNKHV
jgi:hypothetical protein